jgi:hypothetical protein
METDQIAGHSADEQSSKILRLLKVLYRLNAEGVERLELGKRIVALPDSAFVNNKLTAKLTRQLEEIMILARSVLFIRSPFLTDSNQLLVIAFQTGPSISLNRLASYSRSRHVTRSCKAPHLDMPVSSSACLLLLHVTRVTGGMAWTSMEDRSGRRLKSHEAARSRSR